MTAADIVAATSISRVFVALGGDEPTRFGRVRAFYRDGDNQQAVSLNDAKGCWFDHRDQVGGGVLHLIQRVLGCSRGAALSWLSDFTGISLEDREMTRAERGKYAFAARNAEALSIRLADFTRGLELAIEETLRESHESVIDDDIDEEGTLAELHREAHALRVATARDIATKWRVMCKKKPTVAVEMERIGREDREHAEVIAHEIVALLAASVEQGAA